MSIPEYEIDGELYVALEDHIAEVVILAKRLDNVKEALAYCRKREESRSQAASRQALWDADYVSYGDDDRERGE